MSEEDPLLTEQSTFHTLSLQLSFVLAEGKNVFTFLQSPFQDLIPGPASDVYKTNLWTHNFNHL